MKKMFFSSALLLVGASSVFGTEKVQRIPEYSQVDPLFLNRWSPRAMSDEDITQEELMTLFEAARWAPSSYNEQPWGFIYGLRGTPAGYTLFDLLVPFNQEWCCRGAALVVIVSNNDSNRGGSNVTHSFDTGAAWGNLALQGSLMGLVVHGMGGFDREKARKVLYIPDNYTVEAMCVIGRPGNIHDLPEYMQAMEKPSDRKPVCEIACEGKFSL